MAEQASNPTAQQQAIAQPADPFAKCKEITSKSTDFYDIDTRFKLENVEKTAVNYEKKEFWGRAGKQWVFLAAHIAVENSNSEKAPQKYVDCLKRSVENYKKYVPTVIEKYKPNFNLIIENLQFLIAHPDEAFKAHVDILRKTGRIKTLGLQLAK